MHEFRHPISVQRCIVASNLLFARRYPTNARLEHVILPCPPALVPHLISCQRSLSVIRKALKCVPEILNVDYRIFDTVNLLRLYNFHHASQVIEWWQAQRPLSMIEDAGTSPSLITLCHYEQLSETCQKSSATQCMHLQKTVTATAVDETLVVS